MGNKHIKLLQKSNVEGLGRRNDNLNTAQRLDNDEFYTRYEDVHKELTHHKQHLAGKIIYCNCDDYRLSNFYKYLKDNFKEYKLKKLIATCYNSTPHNLFESSDDYRGTLAIYDGDVETVSKLEGWGSFDSPECLKLLELCDVVVTNPPFSKAISSFIPWLLRYKKDFIFIAHLTILWMPQVCKGLNSRKLYVGYNINMKFLTNNGGIKQIQTIWLTTFKTKKHLELVTQYDPSKYPKLDNYDAINVNRLKDIPKDYKGVMGVPITVLMYNNDEFEFIYCYDNCFLKGKKIFARVFMRIKG